MHETTLHAIASAIQNGNAASQPVTYATLGKTTGRPRSTVYVAVRELQGRGILLPAGVLPHGFQLTPEGMQWLALDPTQAQPRTTRGHFRITPARAAILRAAAHVTYLNLVHISVTAGYNLSHIRRSLQQLFLNDYLEDLSLTMSRHHGYHPVKMTEMGKLWLAERRGK